MTEKLEINEEDRANLFLFFSGKKEEHECYSALARLNKLRLCSQGTKLSGYTWHMTDAGVKLYQEMCSNRELGIQRKTTILPAFLEFEDRSGAPTPSVPGDDFAVLYLVVHFENSVMRYRVFSGVRDEVLKYFKGELSFEEVMNTGKVQ
jgi:hypothetical protein